MGGTVACGCQTSRLRKPSALVLALFRVSLKDVILNTETKLYAQRCSRDAFITGVPGGESLAARDSHQTLQKGCRRGDTARGRGKLDFRVNFEINVLPGQVKRPAGNSTPV